MIALSPHDSRLKAKKSDCTFVEKIPPRKRKSISREEELDRPSGSTVRPKFSESTDLRRSQETVVEDYANLKGPTLLKRTLGLQRRHHGLLIGSSGSVEPVFATAEKVLANPSTSHGTSFQRVGNHDVFMIRPDQGTEQYEEETADLDAIEDLVAPHGRALINLYFRIVHPSFPILHKRVYLEKYDRTHREFSPVLLAAVYILATGYWSYNQELSGSPAPDVNALETLALKCMNYAVHRPKLSTVEAGLLLLQRSRETFWPFTAQMVAVGQDLGLHKDCSSWNIPEWERGLRKRLAWALFMQDKWASLVQGRPSHIIIADWSVEPLVEQDFPENFADENDEEGSTEVEKGRILFTSMVSLTQILSGVLASLYSAIAESDIRNSSDATTGALMKAKPLQIRLKEWYADLPQCLNIEQVKFRKLSSSGYLLLAYWATEITLHRAIVRTLATCANPELVSICRQAALARSMSSMAFVKALKPEHWQSFWYFASEYSLGLIGIFEALVSTTLESTKDLESSVDRLDQYQWTLKMSKHTAGFLDKSIAMIGPAAKDLKQRVSSVDNLSNGYRDPPINESVKLHSRSTLSNIYQAEDKPDDVSSGHNDLTMSPMHTSPYHPDVGDFAFFNVDLGLEQSFMEDVATFE
ncbi:uncharacterized protein KY384_005812 [Bacidia gigantensis]|uniref:uncharacterized protein n=1 Tax=Bacidia gigantensis TaxID=2732470 RepID=UPI001D056160|nr:uncharacterized protein KY384_005812 [Bacidia gigantensis]KAG8529177.1 hypothetical protein KY384_005812 [Bacidia gigantensis]